MLKPRFICTLSGLSISPLDSIALDELTGIVGAQACLTREVDLVPYAFDGTAALYSLPKAVVFPKSAHEISRVFEWAGKHRVAVVTRGSGTGLSGGSVPSVGSIVLCTVQMDTILEVDEPNLTARVQPGVTTITLAQRVEALGLMYPPDPGSMKISTLGGNVANNSGGLRGLKYGVTRDYVMALEVVLASGKVVRTGNACVKNAAGYSMKDLFVGSEGTLGIITEILLKLVPKPKARQTLLALFDSLEAAAETVSAIISAKVIPCTLEFLDKTTIRCVEDYANIGLPTEVEAVLLMETDGHPASVADEAEQMRQLAMQRGAREVRLAKNAEESTQLASARRYAFSALARVAPTTILEDVTVKRSDLAKMVRFCQDVAEKHKLKIGIFGHFGDGNLHPTFLTDERNKEEMHRVELAMAEIFEKTIALGGTITGEHGVGLAKKNFLPGQLGEETLELLKDFKRTLDPHNLLNPGKIFDL